MIKIAQSKFDGLQESLTNLREDSDSGISVSSALSVFGDVINSISEDLYKKYLSLLKNYEIGVRNNESSWANVKYDIENAYTLHFINKDHNFNFQPYAEEALDNAESVYGFEKSFDGRPVFYPIDQITALEIEIALQKFLTDNLTVEKKQAIEH